MATDSVDPSVDALVIGLGYVGLPLAQEAARSGLRTAGLDTDDRVVAGLNAGRSHVDDLTDAEVAELCTAGFTATSDPELIVRARVVVVCVPTPLSAEGGPDLSAVVAATQAIAPRVRPGMLVVLESTTYPGTTEEIVVPALEAGSGLVAGQDFHVAFSPERIDPGNATHGMRNTPKIVGGLTAACTERAVTFYSQFVDTVVPAKGLREAETAKLLENTYRHINIALVNEMARFAHELGIDLWNVIDLAATKPFGFQAFRPGPGVGGHCIPIDPNYLSHNVRSRLGQSFRFVELAQEINDSMPTYVARRAQDILNDDERAIRGATVLLLGVTYKPNIADQRNAPSAPLAVALQRLGAIISHHDPLVPQWRLGDKTLDSVPDLEQAVATADLVILVQDHRCYDVDALATTARRFFDTRGRVTVPGAVRL